MSLVTTYRLEYRDLCEDKFSFIKELTIEITDISLKKPMFTRGIDDSTRDESGDVDMIMIFDKDYKPLEYSC